MRRVLFRAAMAAVLGAGTFASAQAQDKRSTSPQEGPESRSAQIQKLQSQLEDLKKQVAEVEAKRNAPPVKKEATPNEQAEELRKQLDRLLQEVEARKKAQFARPAIQLELRTAEPAKSAPNPYVPSPNPGPQSSTQLPGSPNPSPGPQKSGPQAGASSPNPGPQRLNPQGGFAIGGDIKYLGGGSPFEALRALKNHNDPTVARLASQLIEQLERLPKPTLNTRAPGATMWQIEVKPEGMKFEGPGGPPRTPFGWGTLPPGSSAPALGVIKAEGVLTPQTRSPEGASTLKMSTDGKLAAVVAADGSISIFDVASGKQVMSFGSRK